MDTVNFTLMESPTVKDSPPAGKNPVASKCAPANPIAANKVIPESTDFMLNIFISILRDQPPDLIHPGGFHVNPPSQLSAPLVSPLPFWLRRRFRQSRQIPPLAHHETQNRGLSKRDKNRSGNNENRYSFFLVKSNSMHKRVLARFLELTIGLGLVACNSINSSPDVDRPVVDNPPTLLQSVEIDLGSAGRYMEYVGSKLTADGILAVYQCGGDCGDGSDGLMVLRFPEKGAYSIQRIHPGIAGTWWKNTTRISIRSGNFQWKPA